MGDRVTVFLISGKSESGKDTSYELCKNSVGWERVAFADKLKETVADLYNFSHEQMYGDLKNTPDPRYPNYIDPKYIKKYGIFKTKNPDYQPYLTPRRVLQLFGQQQRELNPNIWADYVFNVRIPELIAKGCRNFVVTDTRFPNEIAVGEAWASKADYTTERNLVKLRIERPGVFAKSGKNDISETALDGYLNFDVIAINDGTLPQFKDKLVNIVNSFLV